MRKKMKTNSIFRSVLILFFTGISIVSMAQGAFDTKKKRSTEVKAPSLNAVKIEASRSLAKSTYNGSIVSTPLQKTLSQNPGKPLQPVSTKCEKIVYSSENGLPVFIKTIPEKITKTKSTSLTPLNACYAYLNELKPILMLDYPEEQFTIRNISTDRFSKTHIRLDQVHKGIPVYGADVVVHLNELGAGELFNGRYVKIPDGINTIPDITAAGAVEKASLHLFKGNPKPMPVSPIALIAEKTEPEASLTIFRKKTLLTDYVLTYHVTLFAPNFHRWEYFIDASTGDIIHYYNSTCDADGPKTASGTDLNSVSRTINTYQLGSYYYLLDAGRHMYNAAESDLPDSPSGGILTIDMNNTYGNNQSFQHIVTTNNTSWSPKAVSAHYNAGAVYEYYYQTFGRESIDGNKGTIISIINVPDQETGDDMDNAFWNGRFVCYGNGDVAFKPLAGAMDVAGHEMTHGVIENTANLEYDGESGAINESFADIFGSMMDPEDWLIGEDIVFTSAFPTGCLRSMSDPHNGGTTLGDGGYQPRHMDERYTGSEDNHGVHINNGIGNYTFYLFATAVGRDNAAEVYYKALTQYLTKSSQFIDLRLCIMQAAADIHGAGSDVVTQAGLAFDAVGISDGQPTDVNTTLPENPGEEYLLIMNTDPGDENTLYRSDMALNFEPLSTTTLASRPSVQDDGFEAVFVAGDNTLHSIIASPEYETDEIVIQDEEIWGNVVISKDGNRVGAVTAYADTTIWVYDYESERWAYFTLYNPTYHENLNATGVLYADALEFDVSGEYLVYDAFNTLKNNDGENIEYWDVNFIRVWDNAANDFGDGTIYKLFSSIPEGVSIGNPSFSKNSPNILAFDYFDEEEGVYAILGVNIESNEVITVAENNNLGWPSFNRSDSRIAFTSAYGEDNYAINYVNININTDGEIFSDGIINNMFTGGAWPVYFATGIRNSVRDYDDRSPGLIIDCYPNPFTTGINLKIPRELSQHCRLDILSMDGQLVFSEYYSSVNDNILTPDLKWLTPGTYIIHLRNEQAIATGKIIKVK